MKKIIQIYNVVCEKLAPSFITDVTLLIARIYVAWVFLKSGYLKIMSWDSTRYLFEHEYQVPFLDWQTAMYTGTITEIIFPLFIILGLLTRLNALGLFLVNAIAVISYPTIWENGYYDHKFWGIILLMIFLYGGGRLTIDRLFKIK